MAALLKSALRSVLWLSMVLPDMRYPFGPLGSAAECLFPPSFLHTPRLLVGVHYMVGGGRMGKKEKLSTVQVLLSSNQNTGVSSMLF